MKRPSETFKKKSEIHSYLTKLTETAKTINAEEPIDNIIMHMGSGVGPFRPLLTVGNGAF